MNVQALSPQMAARGMRPIGELANGRPHGDRLRYKSGCRCAECRRANTAYETMRAKERKAGNWNGLVPAEKARLHLAALSAKSVGSHTVSDASGVARSILTDIILGRKKNIRARTERVILAVSEACAADHAYISAAPTWKLLNELITGGYTKAELARHLGYTRPTLQIGRRQVTVRNADNVLKLHARLRLCDAKPTLRLLDNLANEGYTRRHILNGIAQLAIESGVLGQPLLTVIAGRIRVSEARLVEQLHENLTA